MPVTWRVETGAVQQGKGETSAVARAQDGGIALGGSSATRTWKMIAQTVPVESGRSYWLRFEARAVGSKHEPGQPGSVYVGVVDRSKSGIQMASLRAEMTFRETWTPGSAVFRAVGTQADVIAFHAQTGRLEVRAVRWQAIEPSEADEVLISEFDRHYSFFAERGASIDWTKHVAAIRTRSLSVQDSNPTRELLEPFHDPHNWIDVKGFERSPWHVTRVFGEGPIRVEFDAQAIAKRLTSVRQIGRIAFTGDAADGIGYVAIGELPQTPAEADPLVAAVESLLDKKAIVIDLRPCQGGAEVVAQRIGAMLADQRRVYARRRFRSGPEHDAFGPWIDTEVVPRDGPRFSGPIVTILGPGCVSSGEGMAAMLAVLPNVTTVGKPTRGASGYPQPVDLPNGVTVSFSRWQSALPDGTLLEKHGVVPQVPVEETGPDDPTFQKAVEIAKQKIAPPK